jgi:hypothetical protein
MPRMIRPSLRRENFIGFPASYFAWIFEYAGFETLRQRHALSTRFRLTLQGPRIFVLVHQQARARPLTTKSL